MLSKEEIKKWLLENCVDKVGDLCLGNLDFSDFDGNIYISNLKVKNKLYQGCQKVGGNLYQSSQEVEGIIFQDEIKKPTEDELKCPSVSLDYEAEANRLTKENQELKEKLEGYETLLLHLAKELKEGGQNDR